MLGNFRKTSLTISLGAILVTGCGAFEDNVTFVCKGSTETVYFKDGDISSREVSNTRRFIAIKDRKVGNNECMFWNKGRIVCQSSAKSIQHMGEGLSYQLIVDQESGEATEHTESADVQRDFRGKCTRYKGPKI